MAAQLCVRAMGEEHCILHPEHKLVFECKTCQGELTCMGCVTSVHQGHIMGEIAKSTKEKIVKISSFIKRAKETTLPDFVQEISLTIRTLQEQEKKYHDEIQEVKKHEKRLKELVEVYSATQISRLEFLLQEITDTLKRHKRDLEKLQQNFYKDTKEYEQTLKSGSDVLVHDTQAHIVKRSTPIIPSFPGITTSIFSPCINAEEYIAKAFGRVKEVEGKLEDRKTAKVVSGYKFLDQPTTLNELSTSYKVSTNGVHCTPDNNTWILDEGGKLHHIDHIGKEQQTRQPDVKLYKICSHPITGEMFCTTNTRDKSIRRVNTQRGPTIVMFHTDHVPYTIGCTTDNHIVVCMKDKTIRKYNFDGLVLNIYYYRGSTTPDISVCRNTNKIALAGGKDGTVTVLDHSLVELYQYNGHHRQVFHTAAFVDKYLLVGDFLNMNILVLDKDTLVRTIDTKEMSSVAALSVHQDDVLLVGCLNPSKILRIQYIQ